MTVRATLSKFAQIDALNYALTNHIPRRLASHLVGRISRSENPLVCAAALRIWRAFADLDLSDAERSNFRSMHDCFTRRLKPGARYIDPNPNVLTSPCDAIVGASGIVRSGQLLQVKGMEYALTDLLGDADDAASLEGGTYITLRLTSSMYHRFHAPYDCKVNHVRHIFGDRWNVNPPTLRRVARLFCRNERVVVRTRLAENDQQLTLVAVAAILVSGIRLSFLPLDSGGRPPFQRNYGCDVVLNKGDEMGWFEHGSTIIVLAPAGMNMMPSVREGQSIRLGDRLLER